MKVYYGSDPELKQLVNDPCSAHGSHEESEAEPTSERASQPEPVYTSHRFVREGVRVFVDVRACKPVKIDGWDI